MPWVQMSHVKQLILCAHSKGLRDKSDKKFLFDIVANGVNGIDVDKCVSCISVQHEGYLPTMSIPNPTQIPTNCLSTLWLLQISSDNVGKRVASRRYI